MDPRYAECWDVIAADARLAPDQPAGLRGEDRRDDIRKRHAFCRHAIRHVDFVPKKRQQTSHNKKKKSGRVHYIPQEQRDDENTMQQRGMSNLKQIGSSTTATAEVVNRVRWSIARERARTAFANIPIY
ncbi:hypothetical protein EVAR_29183_1 [Eumeta japonica]|uniref:Uncharacterized protein n=1 Tax=Eumeta variegata TaxID=151549 RepID=A0A4C1VBQ1_EUMVA|nr:hypothetical protein EVAR_29183_1 [Eumeta japonica]